MLKGKWLAIALCAVVSGCASVTNPQPASPAQVSAESPAAHPAAAHPPTPSEPPGGVSQPSLPARTYELQDWRSLPDWDNDNLAEALPAFLFSCNVLKSALEWTRACAAAAQVQKGDPIAARGFFESSFAPWLVHNATGATEGLVTGYYEPLLYGSRHFGREFRFPIYAVPPDLLTIDLTQTNPELKGTRLRGRVQDRKIVPYYSRAEIESGLAAVRGLEIVWVDDPVELFFLHVQGSGRIKLPGGEIIRVGFAEHNGHPYVSVGKILVDRGELTVDRASMQGIKQWAAKNPGKLGPLLQQNPAYVFFRELPGSAPGPIGAQGVPLTPGRSIAVDPQTTPLGAPVFLATTAPLSMRPLNRLVVAQDTGTAIKGPVRADFFWGFGDDASQSAGRMRQGGTMWILYPRGAQPRELSRP
jgi:membrane-bound lytic murein transglycosylase A